MNALPTLRRRAAALFVVAFVLIGAGVLPVCGGFCCASDDDESMHAQMPCCTERASLSPMDAVRVPPATASAAIALQPHALPPVSAMLSEPRAPLVASDPAASVHHEPSPPLFLRNAQLLI